MAAHSTSLALFCERAAFFSSESNFSASERDEISASSSSSLFSCLFDSRSAVVSPFSRVHCSISLRSFIAFSFGINAESAACAFSNDDDFIFSSQIFFASESSFLNVCAEFFAVKRAPAAFALRFSSSESIWENFSISAFSAAICTFALSSSASTSKIFSIPPACFVFSASTDSFTASTISASFRRRSL